MKVLITCFSKSWGGLEMYMLEIAGRLLNNKITVEFCCLSNSRLYDEAVKHNFKVKQINARGYFHPLEILKTANYFKQNHFDIIHSGHSKDLWLLVPSLILSNKNIPLVLSKQMGSYIIKKDFLHKLIYNRLNYAFAISNVIAQNLSDTTPLPKNKILLLHNAIDTNKFDPAKVDRNKVRAEFSINPNSILIGMIARFSKGKGHEEFLRAASLLSKKHNNLVFMIVGEPSKGEDQYAEEIKTLANNLGLVNNLIFTGFRTDTPEVLAAFDIFIFPSHAEAFGLSLAEALSMGKPSVCSNSDGVLDIAVDEVTSYLFEKMNWEDLSQKIDRLINDEDKRIEFGLAARKRAVELFDMSVFTNKLLYYYEKAIKESKVL
ncbi:MAG: glycosyltransferase family 4 protein [Melioribacteraceae bacterium]|nr:glycosyltransferase family 4 protein [Melioribacteraceae bacterium]